MIDMSQRDQMWGCEQFQDGGVAVHQHSETLCFSECLLEVCFRDWTTKHKRIFH